MKPAPPTRPVTIGVRVTEDERDELRRSADAAGRTVSQHIRWLLAAALSSAPVRR